MPVVASHLVFVSKQKLAAAQNLGKFVQIRQIKLDFFTLIISTRIHFSHLKQFDLSIFECLITSTENLFCVNRLKCLGFLIYSKFKRVLIQKLGVFVRQCSNCAMFLRVLQCQSLNFVPQDCSKVLELASVVLWKENLTRKPNLNILLPGINSRSFK